MEGIEEPTGRRTPYPATVSLKPAADLLLTMWILSERVHTGVPSDLALGSRWFDDLAATLSESSAANLASVGSGDVWISLLSLLAETNTGGSVADYVDFLADYDAADLRHRLIHAHGFTDGEHRDLVADVAEGRVGRLDALLALPGFVVEHEPRRVASLHKLLTMSPNETKDLLVGTVSGVYSEAFARHEARFRSFLEADFHAKQALARCVSVERLIEIATSGSWVPEEYDSRPIVLLPSIVARPRVVTCVGSDFLVVAYPVPDECLSMDADAPPPWLVTVYKALGDERRLRILRRLAASDASLAELSRDSEIAKSTLHHHLSLLRAAGLVTIRKGGNQQYSLHSEVLSEAGRLLDYFVDPEQLRQD